ncbi:MAG: hypothetical protein OEY38_13285 [Gammaproteobacteria bacterium]|nr:hypothetical protein [Gammaproteobacteria bacterium]
MLTTTANVVIIVIAVLLFFALGIAIMVIMDHKAKIPGDFTQDFTTISGMRRDHPVIAFLTTAILLSIILTLLAIIVVTVVSEFDLFHANETPTIIDKLKAERTDERLRHFHNISPTQIREDGKQTVCFFCHGLYPHSKEPMIRTLMNMHTQFIGCMTCHVDEKKIPEKNLKFAWLNYSGFTVTGKPFGLHTDDTTGSLAATDDYYSKIVPYRQSISENNLLELTQLNAEVEEFVSIRASLSDQDKAAIKSRFHKYVKPKGRFCAKCHTSEKQAYLSFEELGFSKRRIQALTNMNIIGLIEKYETFYMPNILKGKHDSDSQQKSLPNKKQLDDANTMQNNPTQWWEKTFDKR